MCQLASRFDWTAIMICGLRDFSSLWFFGTIIAGESPNGVRFAAGFGGSIFAAIERIVKSVNLDDQLEPIDGLDDSEKLR